jgi:DNA-binding MarR family transcriptional regulator
MEFTLKLKYFRLQTMAVKARKPNVGVSPSGPELAEAMALLGQVFRGFKRNAGGPPPAALIEAFERGALGPRHMPVLMTVTVEGPLSVSELAERVGLTVATTSLLVGELDREDLVERNEDEHDRRRTLVRTKPRHRKQLAEWAKKRREPMRRALARMTPDERAALMRGWRILDEEVSGGGSAR